MYRGPGDTSWSPLANMLNGHGDLMFALYSPGQLVPPSVSLGSVQAIGPTSAVVTGTVNPNGFSVTHCHFAYGPGIADGFSNVLFKEVACNVLPGSGTSEVTVSATLTGLWPNTGYSYVLSASNASGTIESNISLFITTAKPWVVPKVKGKTLGPARKAITKAHCSVGEITKVKSSTKDKGHVLSQSPKPGKHLKNGARVALKVGR